MLRAAGIGFVAVVSVVTFVACRGEEPQLAASSAIAADASAPPPRGGVNPNSAAAESVPPSLAAAHGSQQPAAPVVVEPIAPVPGGLSIADVWAQRASLSGKPVTVRGQVVKANNNILGTNWVHLQDGSGSASERTHDLTVTTSAIVKAGDVVTITGVLATGKVIGEGYAYDVLVENATIVK